MVMFKPSQVARDRGLICNECSTFVDMETPGHKRVCGHCVKNLRPKTEVHRVLALGFAEVNKQLEVLQAEVI